MLSAIPTSTPIFLTLLHKECTTSCNHSMLQMRYCNLAAGLRSWKIGVHIMTVLTLRHDADEGKYFVLPPPQPLPIYTALHEGHTDLYHLELPFKVNLKCRKLHMNVICRRMTWHCWGKGTGETRTDKALTAFNDLTAFFFTTGCSTVHTQQQNE